MVSTAAGTARTKTHARIGKMAFATDIEKTVRADARPGLIADLQERVARYRLYRKTVNELGALNGRELADLGICRAQVRALAYEIAYRDHM
jgi:uncharacterized protein YjiS (DUF1127 family)